MKTKTFIAGVLVVALFASADTVIPAPRILLPSNAPIVLTATATNDLTSTLQRGLFEEEGNRDLDAAISAYQSLAAQFDRSRQVAATAIFRLGECYRKLGRTNEAVAQYDRIVREFSDQQTLATLSRQNIAGLGSGVPTSAAPSMSSGPTLDSLQSQYALLRAQIEQARNETNLSIVAKLFDDQGLQDALNYRYQTRQILESYKANSNPPEAIRNAETNAAMAQEGLESRRKWLFDFQQKRLDILQSAIQQTRTSSSPASAFSPAVRAEQRQLLEEEIKLVQKRLDDEEALVKKNLLMPTADSLYANRRELLSLQRQLAALSDEGLETGRTAGGATLDSLQSQYALLKAQLEQARKETNFLTIAKLLNDQDLREALDEQKHFVRTPESRQQFLEAAAQRAFDYAEKHLKVLQSAIQQARSGRSAQSPDGSAQSEAAVLNEQLRELKKMNRDQERIFVQQNFPNAVLTKLMQDLADAQQKLATLTGEFSAEHPSVQQQKELIAMINEQIHEQVEGVVAGLQIRLKAAQREQLEQPNAASGAQESAVTDDEEKEIRRIQAMLQNSPDLLNSLAGGDGGEMSTPLGHAASRDQLRVARFLLDHGADVNRRSEYGVPPLFIAAEGGHKAMVELLLDHGADINAKRSKSTGWVGAQTALGIAVIKNFPAVVETLLARKADPNIPGFDGLTPLQRATQQSNQRIIELLLRYGANPSSKD